MGIGFLLGLSFSIIEYFVLKKKFRIKMVTLFCFSMFVSFGVISGFVFPIKNNTAFVIVSTILRTLQGYIEYAGCHGLVVSARMWFPEKFQTVNGITIRWDTIFFILSFFSVYLIDCRRRDHGTTNILFGFGRILYICFES